jgi:hypothetical protein
MKKWILIAVGTLAGIIIIMAIIGATVPRDHVASTTALIPAPRPAVWRTVVDVASAPQWRDVKRVEVLSASGQPLRWREVTGFGTITFEQQEGISPEKFVARIADKDQGFGGTWTYEMEPEGTGTRVKITERGFVSNPIFRFMSRYVFGYYRTQESYLKALGKKFGAAVVPVRS